MQNGVQNDCPFHTIGNNNGGVQGAKKLSSNKNEHNVTMDFNFIFCFVQRKMILSVPSKRVSNTQSGRLLDITNKKC